jgi:hypothetical protein
MLPELSKKPSPNLIVEYRRIRENFNKYNFNKNEKKNFQ